jgi:hypothetical protein
VLPRFSRALFLLILLIKLRFAQFVYIFLRPQSKIHQSHPSNLLLRLIRQTRTVSLTINIRVHFLFAWTVHILPLSDTHTSWVSAGRICSDSPTQDNVHAMRVRQCVCVCQSENTRVRVRVWVRICECVRASENVCVCVRARNRVKVQRRTAFTSVCVLSQFQLLTATQNRVK